MFGWWRRKASIAVFLCVMIAIVFTGCGLSQSEGTEVWTDQQGDSISETVISENTTESNLSEAVRIIDVKSYDLRVLQMTWDESDWHVPVILSTHKEYQQYLLNVLTECVWEADYQNTDEVEFLKKYEEEWFDFNGLLMLPIKHSDWNYAHEVELTYLDKSGRLEINVLATYPEEKIYPIESYWLLVVELKKEDIGNMTEMSVTLTEAVDETQLTLKSETHILDYTLMLDSDDNIPKENVFTIRSKKDMEAFYRQIQFTDEPAVDELKNLIENYNNDWFEENMLVLIRMTTPATGFKYDLRTVLDTETNKIRIELFEHHEGILFDVQDAYLFVVEVDKTENRALNEIDGYEACRPYTGFN